MKKYDFKEMICLIGISVLCAIPTLTAFGQETASISDMVVTSVAIRDLSDFSNSKIVGKDGEKEIVIENLGKGFETGISYQLVDMGTNEKGEIIKQGGSNVLIAQIEYDDKPYSINLEVGIKLKYKLVDGKAVILFDESYCLAIDEGINEMPADFDASLYVDITLEEFNKWENAKSGEIGLFKATVYHMIITDAIMRMAIQVNSYSFSDTPRDGGRSVILYPFKYKHKWARMKDGQKVIIYFNAISNENFKEKIIDFIEIIE